jgi:hypothetical protein
VLDGEFKAHPGIAVQTATFTRAEVKALGTVTIAGLLTAAKAQLQILE